MHQTHHPRMARSVSTYSLLTNFCSLEIVYSLCKMYNSNCFASNNWHFVVYLVLSALWTASACFLTPVRWLEFIKFYLTCRRSVYCTTKKEFLPDVIFVSQFWLCRAAVWFILYCRCGASADGVAERAFYWPKTRRRWTDDIKNWSSTTVAEFLRLIRDRQQWRRLVHKMLSDL